VSVELAAGDWRVTFMPELGMLGTSITHRGRELLSLGKGVEAYRAGHTVGLPLLAPWANRLSRFRFEVEGVDVELEGAPNLHLDGNGLPIHGTMTAQTGWQVVRNEPRRLTTRFAYDSPELLAAFPFPHELEIDVSLRDGVRVATAVTPTSERPVPVSFGWHPYYRVENRREAMVRMPARLHRELDANGIPTGRETPLESAEGRLGDDTYDDLYALRDDRRFSLDGLEIRFGEAYPYAQLFAPPGSDFVAIEPMTAPTNALVTGDYQLVPPGERFEAEFFLSTGDDE